MTLFLVCIGVVITQRLVELRAARNHSQRMFAMGAVEYDRSGYKLIVLMHICFFASLITEFALFQRNLNPFWYIFALIFFFAQFLRYWAIKSLGIFWNTRIIVLRNSRLVDSGAYRFFKHPNYTAVVLELAFLPLIFSCYFTALFFTVVNLLVLKRRVTIETNALKQS